MQVGSLDWTLGQKEDIGEVQVQCGVQSTVMLQYQCWFLGLDKRTLATQDVNNGRNQVGKPQEISSVFTVFL